MKFDVSCLCFKRTLFYVGGVMTCATLAADL